MFCFKCGFQIPDNASFCPACGTSQNGGSNTIAVTNTVASTGDYDRNAIKIYLSNVLSLECARNKISKILSATNSEIKTFEIGNFNKRYHYFDIYYLWFRYDGEKYYLLFNKGKYNDYFISSVSKEPFGYWYDIDYNWDYLNDYNNWSYTSATPLNLFTDLLFDLFIKKGEQKAFRDFFLASYRCFKDIAPKSYSENLIPMQPIYKKRENLQNEYTAVDKLLKEAYDIDIIPQQFRNIYAIWFIHDYIKTSNETLSSAFLQCNLDEIKQKLDTIIEQQEELILNQKIQLAQNKQIINQNQQTLNHLARIESNTERAAQYSQIAANNAEACAWIGIANYIRD